MTRMFDSLARILGVLLKVLLSKQRLLLSDLDRLGLRARGGLIEARACSLWLVHVEGYRLGPGLVRLDIVVVDVIVVYDVCHILRRLLVATLGNCLSLIVGR